MSKRKPMKLKALGSAKGAMLSTVLKWVGPNRPGKYVGYLRLHQEDESGKEVKYLGSLADRDLRRLYGWLKTHLEAQ